MNVTTIIDGPYLTYRAYCATDKHGMFGSTVSVALDFLRWADRVCIAWEHPSGLGRELRRAISPDYKANRERKPQEYLDGVQRLQDVLCTMGVEQHMPLAGEADDAAYTLVQGIDHSATAVELWTRDKDWAQMLALPNVSLLLPATRGLRDALRVQTDDDVVAWLGVPPRLVVPLLALAGDTSDNVPGMPRIGKGRAAGLLRACPELVHLVTSGRGHEAEERVLAADAVLAPYAALCTQNHDLLQQMVDLVRLRAVNLASRPAALDMAQAERELKAIDCDWALPRLREVAGDDWGETAEPEDDWSE